MGSLSPSRAGDFRACPLRYRLRVIDRLAEPASTAAVRGTVVHQVLEWLFDLPSAERTPARAQAMVHDAWDAVRAEDPAALTMFPDAGADAGRSRQVDLAGWLAGCRAILDRYFTLEDPQLLEPAHREQFVETALDSGLLLRGIIDRLDVAPDGATRVVDYKTGRSPGPGHEANALFQLRFYALVLWRTTGVVPALLQLIYLGDGVRISCTTDEAGLRATERVVDAVGAAITTAEQSGQWLPSPGVVCRWCSFQSLCPAYGGTPPPLPESPTGHEPAVADPVV